jgi:SAM-dependent methyltransferase
MPDSIYERPADYDLEHGQHEDDIEFYRRLVLQLRPRRVLELGSGSGRVTLPMALALGRGGRLVGVDVSGPMLEQARTKLAEACYGDCAAVDLVEADFRDFGAPEPFDLVVVPCSTLSHVLELDDQLRVFRNVFDLLRPGGRFVADVALPNFQALAESMQVPPRALVEMDIDSESPGGDARLIRYKTTRYEPHQQRARVHFFYDRFDADSGAERRVSDFVSHVYFPRELALLFRSTGFEIEATYGSHDCRPLTARSRDMIVVGRRP